MATPPRFQLLELGRLAEPFDHPDWLFELKYDGFRARADVTDGKAELISRRGNVYKSWTPLREQLGRELGDHQAVLDGELVVLDADGRSLFYDLLRRRHPPIFVAFDLLFLDGEDLREIPLLERKRRLRALLPEESSSLLYAQHVIGAGRALFDQVCALDLEGIVAKLASAPYRAMQPPHWMKIKSSAYSQVERRYEFFEPSRNKR